MKETKQLEFKENITKTFLKTVSAYANYGTGVIVFGIADNGEVKGLLNPEKVCLDIENRINDSINPIPEYSLEIEEADAVIRLTVKEGLYKPYLYKAKAYRRNDTATIEVDRLELMRLILEGKDASFEELPAQMQELQFDNLFTKLQNSLKLQNVSQDTLKTLELYKEGKGFNVAGELLADKNSFPGIDMVFFGDNISIIRDREVYAQESVLLQFEHALEMYRKYYQYEQIKGALREKVELIPEEAYREAIANALVHRTWDVKAHINVAMFKERIEITSPGGLPKGMHEEEYYCGGISVLRNRILGNVFLRLQMIERFGTGIRRINEAYSSSKVKPLFQVSENSIKIILPLMQLQNNLSEEENKVYASVKGRTIASSAIVASTGLSKYKVIGILKKLCMAGYIRAIGKGRGLKYTAD